MLEKKTGFDWGPDQDPFFQQGIGSGSVSDLSNLHQWRLYRNGPRIRLLAQFVPAHVLLERRG